MGRPSFSCSRRASRPRHRWHNCTRRWCTKDGADVDYVRAENTYISIEERGFVILPERRATYIQGKEMKKKKSERKRERSSAPLGTIKLGGLSPRSHLNVRSKEAAYLWPRDKIARAILITHRRDSRRIVKRGDVETVRLSTNSPAINDRATEYKLRPREKSLSTIVLDVNDHFETPKRKMKKKE